VVIGLTLDAESVAVIFEPSDAGSDPERNHTHVPKLYLGTI
jgi:hypothetical protein